MTDSVRKFWEEFALVFGRVASETDVPRTMGQILDETIGRFSSVSEGLAIIDTQRLAELEAAAVWNTDMGADELAKYKASGIPVLGWFEPMPGYLHDDLPTASVMWWQRCHTGEQDGWSWHGAPMSRPIAWKPITPHEGV